MRIDPRAVCDRCREPLRAHERGSWRCAVGGYFVLVAPAAREVRSYYRSFGGRRIRDALTETRAAVDSLRRR